MGNILEVEATYNTFKEAPYMQLPIYVSVLN